MGPKLLKSFTVVVTFWFVATTIWWSLQQPEVNLQALAAIKALLPFLPIEVPDKASIASSLRVQLQVLLHWTAPLLIGSALSAGAGYAFIWWGAKGKKMARTERETGTGEYRGVTLTVGELPVPHPLPKDDIELSAEAGSPLERMSPGELRLLEEILGTLSAHPDAYAGDDVGGALLEHAMALVEKALDQPKNASLLALVAAGSELGKITAYKPDTKNPGKWVLAKSQDREAARILGMMPAWFALPYESKHAVMAAVKYRSTPKTMPEFESNEAVYRLARSLLTQREDAQQKVVAEVQQKTFEKAAETLPDAVFSAFLQGLPSMSFQTRDLPKGVRATAWKEGGRVFMLEIALRESVMPKLPQDVRIALTPPAGVKTRLHPFTVELLKSLAEKKWLVSEIESMVVEPKEALWNVKAGKLEFKGVIVIDVPDEHQDQLPKGDSFYALTVTGPLFQSASTRRNQAPDMHSMSKDDLLGSVLRAGPAREPSSDEV